MISQTEFKNVVYKEGAEVLGLRTIKHRDWFADNSTDINQLLEKKRLAFLKKLNAKPENSVGLSRAYKERCAQSCSVDVAANQSRTSGGLL